MAGKKQDKPKQDAAPQAPVYLSTSNPPKPHIGLLIGMAVVTVVWFSLLAYLALQQVGTI